MSVESKNKIICPCCGTEMVKNEPDENMSFDVLAVCPRCKYVEIDEYEEEE